LFGTYKDSILNYVDNAESDITAEIIAN